VLPKHFPLRCITDSFQGMKEETQPGIGLNGHLVVTISVADPDRLGPDPDPTSENRPDPDPVKTGSGFI
jgi:hypothetical protein